MSNSNSTILKNSLAANNEIIIFDRTLKRRQRKRAEKLISKYDFLLNVAAEKLLSHLEGITKKFPEVLDFADRGDFLANKIKDKFGIKRIFSDAFLGNEEIVSAEPESFDLIISLMNLHWVNDLPGCLIQLHHALKKDGLLLASMLGGNTLNELRLALTEVEIKLTGGASPRISPFADARDGAGLLQRAYFAMPVADTETITILYKDVFSLMRDLRGMAETSALIKRNKKYVGKYFFSQVDKKYKELFANAEGEIPATFEIITLSGTKN